MHFLEIVYFSVYWDFAKFRKSIYCVYINRKTTIYGGFS